MTGCKDCGSIMDADEASDWGGLCPRCWAELSLTVNSIEDALDKYLPTKQGRPEIGQIVRDLY